MDTVTIEEKKYDEAAGGWYVYCLSVIDGVTRRGAEFIALPETATEQELSSAILMLYGGT